MADQTTTDVTAESLRAHGLDLRQPLTTEDGTTLAAWTTIAPLEPDKLPAGRELRIMVLSGPQRGNIYTARTAAVTRAWGMTR